MILRELSSVSRMQRQARGGARLAVLLALAACQATPNRYGETPPSGESAAPHDEATGDVAAQSAPGGAGTATSPAAPTKEPNAAPKGASSGDVVARVAGQPVYAAELLAQWMHRDAGVLRGHLENLVFSRLVVAEARRLSIQLDAAMVDARYQEGLDRLRGQIAKDEPGLTLEKYVTDRLGLDPDHYMADLRRDLETDLLAERCVRAWLLSCERAEVRVIVLDSREDVEAVQAELDKGGDFADLAREHSLHESKENGGRVPPVVRSDSGLARLAFATATGTIGGPIFEDGKYLLLQVTGRPEPVEGTWSAVGAAVEASLTSQPIEDPEYWQWKHAMQETYVVDLSPLRELLEAQHTAH
jgi:foldase protein PrsA